MSRKRARKQDIAPRLDKVFQSCQGLQSQLWQLSRCVAGQYRQQILSDPRFDDSLRLERYGYKVWSQNDEDGYLQEILHRIGVKQPAFLEIGVGDGLENNTHFLLAQGNRGAWIEAAGEHCLAIARQFAPYLERQQLRLLHAAATPENIEALCRELEVPQGLDVLSIDIDGHDYYVWRALATFSPKVVIIEYNGKLPPSVELIQPYAPGQGWDGSDGFGVSLAALESLGRSKGYCLVGCEIAGNNAFFVRQDLVGNKFQLPFTAANHFHPCRYELTCAGAFAKGHPAKATDWMRPNQEIEKPIDPEKWDGNPFTHPTLGWDAFLSTRAAVAYCHSPAVSEAAKPTSKPESSSVGGSGGAHP
jgi:hypothetical protein